MSAAVFDEPSVQRLQELGHLFRLPVVAEELGARLQQVGHDDALGIVLEVFERESARSREALSAFLNSRRGRRQVQALHTAIETAEAAKLRAASQMLVVDLQAKLAGLVAGTTDEHECGRVLG